MAENSKNMNFEAARGYVKWFKVIFFIKAIESYHKLSFETICIGV